jgi:hypothetical protein
MTVQITKSATGRSLISEELFARLVRRMIDDEKLNDVLAERVLDQALAFLGTCARERGGPIAPSELVDVGWHTFILHTREYAEFCVRVAGRFLHHVPTDEDDPDTHGGGARARLNRTVRAIEQAGFMVDADLWPAATDKCNVRCSQCKNGCTDDPPPAV